MNREIKFKVWDVINKRIFPFEEAVSTGVDISTPDGRNYQMPLFSVAFVDNKHKLIALQYTNLNDKNGKELYDGDIVKVRESNEQSSISYENKLIVWDNVELRWGLSHKDFSIFSEPLNYFKGSLELVGNVFENKDLLK